MVCQKNVEVHKKIFFGLDFFSQNFRKFQNFDDFFMKMSKENFNEILKFSKISRLFFSRPKKNFFVDLKKFFDIPYRSEILSTFDCWYLESDWSTL